MPQAIAPAPSSGPASWLPLLRDFWRLAGPYWRSPRRFTAWALSGGMIALTVAQVALAVALNFWNQRFFDAIGAGQLDLFYRLIGLFAAIVLAQMLVNVAHLNVKRRLQIDWREWLTRRVVEEWMVDGRHYRLGQAAGDPDNPDGRIAEDIRNATEFAVELANSAIYSNLLLISFVEILWTLSGVVSLQFGGMDLELPGHLVWIALAYAVVGIWAALLVGRSLSPAANRRQGAEQDFRFGLARARQNALGIALLGGEADERRRFFGLFDGAIAAWQRQTRALSSIFAYTSGWSLLSVVFPVLVAAPRYIAGTISLGTLMQSAQAFQQMAAALSWPVDNLAHAADWRASVERVRDLERALQPSVGRAPPGPVVARDAAGFALQDVSLREPDGRVLVQHLDLSAAPGERLVATGPSEVTGRLFAAIAGLWPWADGCIMLPRLGGAFFVPQSSYLPSGKLRDAVCYPTPPDTCGDGAIAAALQRVGLEDLTPRLHETAAWEHALSHEEQQRMAVARLLLHRPAAIFLDNAFDALEPAQEDAMMDLIERAFPDAVVLSIRRRAGATDGFTRRIAFELRDGAIVLRDTPLKPH